MQTVRWEYVFRPEAVITHPHCLHRTAGEQRSIIQFTIISYIHSLVFSPQAGFSRNQSPVKRPVWLWHTASWANSQGQVAIAFPRLQTFPPSPLGAFTSNDTKEPQQRKVELFVGEKCSDKFRREFDFHVILEIFYMPQICYMGQSVLLPLRRKAC